MEYWRVFYKTKINEAIKQALQQFENKYFIEGVVNKSKVIQDLDGYDAALLESFFTNGTIKKEFHKRHCWKCSHVSE